MLDLLLTGGLLVDGTGAPSVLADIGVVSGKYAMVMKWKALAPERVLPGLLPDMPPRESLIAVAGRLFGSAGGVDLELPPRTRGPERDPPDFSGPEYGPSTDQ